MSRARPYDSYCHLSRTLFKKPSDLMGMLSAYFDDSGTDQYSRTAVVGGYVGSDFQWRRFVARWSKTLDEAQVKILHRSDLENFQGEFTEAKGWNPSRRTELVRKLHSIIKTSTYSAVAAAVVKDDFNAVMPSWVKHLFGGAYGWCAFMCVLAMRGWCTERHHSDPIAWVFESGTAGAPEIGEMFQALQLPELRALYRISSVTFDGKELKSLQAADLVAYEIFKHTENQVLDGGRNWPRRRSALDLFRRQDERYLTFWDRGRLINWLADCDKERPFGDVPIDQVERMLRRK
jgi:hypothetical protein